MSAASAKVRKDYKEPSARMRNVSRVEAVTAAGKVVATVKPVGTSDCRFCGALNKSGIDLHCCPLAVESDHCLWCGDDLIVEKGGQAPRSFCKPACSVAFHKDVGTDRRERSAPRLNLETIRRAAKDVEKEPWFWQQGTHLVNAKQARFLCETPPAVVRALLERLAHAERVIDVARGERESSRVGRAVREYDTARTIWGKAWKS